MIDVTNSPAFRVRELEEENRRLRKDRDQKAKDVEFWKGRAGGLVTLFRTEPGVPPPAAANRNETNVA